MRLLSRAIAPFTTVATLVACAGAPAPAPAPPPPAKPVLDYAGQIEGLADRLADQIASGTSQRRLVAVLPFTDSRGLVYSLGSYTAEELVTSFGTDQRFDVIERARLDQVMKEIALSSSDLINDDTARSIGNLLGADVLVIGTFTDIGEALDLNTRLVETESGRIVGADSVVLEREPLVVKLWTPAPRMKPVVQATNELAAPAPQTAVEPEPSGPWGKWLGERAMAREIKRHRRERHFPLKIEGRNNAGRTEYRAIFTPYPTRRFWHYVVYGATEREVARRHEKFTRKGRRVLHTQTFVDPTGTERHQAVWTE